MDVLLVDDNRELRGATRELLEILGHRVTEAACGEEALERAPGQSFALLVTDLAMPGIDGVELTSRMLRRAPDLAVLMISSETEDRRVRERIARGDVAFLAKPFSIAELEAAIGVAVAARSKRAAEPPPAAVHRASPVHETRPVDAGSRPVGAGSPPAPAGSPPASAGSRRRRPPLRSLALAAMAAVAAALAIVVLEPAPPDLPVPPPTSAVRGTEVELFDPVGPIAELPAAFRWRPVEGAGVYQLTVRSIDENVLWHGEVDGPPLELPPELAEHLLPAVAYTWAVAALDDAGSRIAWSGRTRFRVLPRAGDATVADPR